jgi:selenocysteine lyase/cysteine desulfurase
MPQTLPQALEAGTPNTPARMGLLAALEELEGKEVSHLKAELSSLHRIWDGLQDLETQGKLRRLGPPPDFPNRVAVLSLDLLGRDPFELAMALESQGFLLRAGQHCAPWIHQELKTYPLGTLRLSPGPDLEDQELLSFLEILQHYFMSG